MLQLECITGQCSFFFCLPLALFTLSKIKKKLCGTAEHQAKAASGQTGIARLEVFLFGVPEKLRRVDVGLEAFPPLEKLEGGCGSLRESVRGRVSECVQVLASSALSRKIKYYGIRITLCKD